MSRCNGFVTRGDKLIATGNVAVKAGQMVQSKSGSALLIKILVGQQGPGELSTVNAHPGINRGGFTHQKTSWF